MNMLVANDAGGYHYRPGLSALAQDAVAVAGFVARHVRVGRSPPMEESHDRVERALKAADRPSARRSEEDCRALTTAPAVWNGMRRRPGQAPFVGPLSEMDLRGFAEEIAQPIKGIAPP